MVPNADIDSLIRPLSVCQVHQTLETLFILLKSLCTSQDSYTVYTSEKIIKLP